MVTVIKACDALKMSAKKKGTSLETKILLSRHSGSGGDNDDMVVGDGLRFRQVLIHLISNAIKFTPSNGHITVTVTSTTSQSSSSSPSPHDDLRVEVTDTGTLVINLNTLNFHFHNNSPIYKQ